MNIGEIVHLDAVLREPSLVDYVYRVSASRLTAHHLPEPDAARIILRRQFPGLRAVNSIYRRSATAYDCTIQFVRTPATRNTSPQPTARINILDSFGRPAQISSQGISVYLNEMNLMPTRDYSRVDHTITFHNPISEGSLLRLEYHTGGGARVESQCVFEHGSFRSLHGPGRPEVRFDPAQPGGDRSAVGSMYIRPDGSSEFVRLGEVRDLTVQRGQPQTIATVYRSLSFSAETASELGVELGVDIAAPLDPDAFLEIIKQFDPNISEIQHAVFYPDLFSFIVWYTAFPATSDGSTREAPVASVLEGRPIRMRLSHFNPAPRNTIPVPVKPVGPRHQIRLEAEDEAPRDRENLMADEVE